MQDTTNIKTGRNDPCVCGSGIKYKKCCLQQSNKVFKFKNASTNVAKNWVANNQDVLVMTSTNEPYMPIRLYYEIYDHKALLFRLEQLKCVSWTEQKNHFFINYEEETKNINLSIKYNKVPAELFPVILADGAIIDDANLHIDLRSFDRAVQIIEFIDRHIDRSIIKVTFAATYNQFQAANKNNIRDVWDIDYDELFSAENNMITVDPEVEMEEMRSLVSGIHDPLEKFAILNEESQRSTMRLVEKFPVHFYEEGIQHIDGCLKFRMIIANEHWKGNTNFRPYDLAQKMVAGVLAK